MKIQEVIDRVLTDSTGETRIAPTCDQLMTGDHQQEVKGIAVTYMATVEVIREAAAKGVNFIITHEPTWYRPRCTGLVCGRFDLPCQTPPDR